MERNMKFIVSVFFVLTCLISNAQVGVSLGPSLLKTFNPTSPYCGVNLGVEIPSDMQTTYYIKLSNYFRKADEEQYFYNLNARDINTSPQVIAVNANYTNNFISIEGGTRYYFVGSYDFGFGMYGGTNLMLGYSSIKLELDPYDEDLYESNLPRKGAAINFSVGLQGGLKYSIPNAGTVFLEPGGSFVVFGVPSNDTAASGYRLTNLLFTVHLGFRKDIF